MQKKMNNKRLLIIFLILLVLVVVLFTQKNGRRERSFNTQLVNFNADNVTQILLYPKSLNGESIEIDKTDDSWSIKSDGQTYKANNRLIDGMVNELQNLTAKSIVANSKDYWKTYEVNDSLASKVEIYKGKKKLAAVYIGKFKFTQPQNMSTYVRVSGKKETYKVDGFLSSTFNQKVNDLRDKTIIDDKIANWSKLTFDYPADSSFVLNKVDKKWMIDGVMADSAAVVRYINSAKRTKGSSITSVDGENASGLFRLTIDRDNLAPVIIDVKDVDGKKILHSSENTDTWFDDKSTIKRLFVPRSKFVIK